MAQKVETAILKGTPYFAPFSNPLALVSVGNTSKITYTLETESKELQDYENPGGGLNDEFTRLKSGKISLSLRKISVENWALAMGADIKDFKGEAVADEVHEASHGCLIVLKQIQNLDEAMTVTDEVGGDEYQEGVDYIRKRAGLIPLESGGIPQGGKIKVSYKSTDHASMQPMVDLTREYHVFFDGVNERTNAAVQADFYRVKLSPAKSIEFIGEDFMSLDIEGVLLKDEGKTGIGVSQYCNIKVAA